MRIGALRRRITLLEGGGGGQQDPDTGILIGGGWTPVVSDLPAAIEPLSAREYIASAAGQARVSTRITIRYRDGVTSQLRVQDDRGKVYTIEGPPLADKDSGLDYLTLVCLELEGEPAP